MITRCTVDDCGLRMVARGWCGKHYQRWKKHGDPVKTAYGTVEERFWRHVDPCRTDGCALFVGGQAGGGYGTFWNGERLIPAHHFLVGRPTDGLVWDHVKDRGCNHRNCVWPEHLEMVTQSENVRRSDANERASAWHREYGRGGKWTRQVAPVGAK